MHILSPTLLLTLLPSIIAADWLDKAKQYIPSNVPTVPNPIDAGAAKVAEYKVEKINERNFQRKLGPKLEGEEEWMIYLTGGNKTCFGRCEPMDLVWNESISLMAALPKVPNSELHFGRINCEVEQVLCTGMAATVPAVYHFIFPQKLSSGSQPLSPMREVLLNITSPSVSDITSLPRGSASRYLEYPEYTGSLHIVDGWIVQKQLLIPIGWLLWGFGSTPSWLIMIGISFFSRQVMSRRAGQRVDASRRPAAAAAPAAGAKKRN